MRSLKSTPPFAVALVVALLTVLLQAPVNGQSEFDLGDLRRDGDRILASEVDFARIRNNEWDELGQRYLAFLRETGEALLDLPAVEYELRGIRMLHVSRQFRKRVTNWSLLYRVDGNEVFRDRAIAEMEAVVAFPNWNPQHYLDIGEMTLGLSIGLDWLWDELSSDQKERFLTAIIEKGIKPSLDESDPDNWWIYYNNNWNPVCHAGLVAGAILIAERDPELADRVIKRALQAVPVSMNDMNPDGVYSEGPNYWGYGAQFTAFLIDLLEHAFGSSYGLADHQAFQKSVVFRSLAVSPTGRFYNFYDGPERAAFSPVTAWFASYYGTPAAAFEMRRGLKDFLEHASLMDNGGAGGNLASVALWYPDLDRSPVQDSEFPLHWMGEGPNPIAFVRENWDDPNAFYLGFKGGRGTISHAHLDAGSFVFEDEGVRWGIDLGSQNYLSIESKGLGMWDRRQHADRWRVFRIGPYSHNVLLIDQRLQNVEAEARISSFFEDGEVIQGIVDLSTVYEDQASRYERTFKVHRYEVLQITDEVVGARERTERQGRKTASLRWRMLTRASIELGETGAVLTQDGKTLYVKVVLPDTFVLRGDPVDPPPYYWDEVNPGVNALDIWSKVDNAGNGQVIVLMSTDADALAKVAESL